MFCTYSKRAFIVGFNIFVNFHCRIAILHSVQFIFVAWFAVVVLGARRPFPIDFWIRTITDSTPLTGADNTKRQAPHDHTILSYTNPPLLPGPGSIALRSRVAKCKSYDKSIVIVLWQWLFQTRDPNYNTGTIYQAPDCHNSFLTRVRALRDPRIYA